MRRARPRRRRRLKCSDAPGEASAVTEVGCDDGRREVHTSRPRCLTRRCDERTRHAVDCIRKRFCEYSVMHSVKHLLTPPFPAPRAHTISHEHTRAHAIAHERIRAQKNFKSYETRTRTPLHTSLSTPARRRPSGRTPRRLPSPRRLLSPRRLRSPRHLRLTCAARRLCTRGSTSMSTARRWRTGRSAQAAVGSRAR